MDELRREWSLREGVTFLNHGSFGLLPQCVQAAQREWQNQITAEPVDFLARRLRHHVEESLATLGRFVGVPPDCLIPMDNATAGVNVVAASVELRPGDEVLLTDHEYGAVRRIWERKCRQSGANLVTASIPVPLVSVDDATSALFASVTPHTRIAVITHVTSPTAIVFPVAAWCEEFARRGIITCVDGPHAVAMLPLELSEIPCDYYAASCHKWLSAPVGSGFLYVHPRRQASVQPVVVSWGRPKEGGPPSWKDEFHWLGTRDPTAFLSVTAAIGFLERFGLEWFRAYGHGLARRARSRLLEVPGTEPLSSEDDAWFGAMAAAAIPHSDPDALHQVLWEQYRIEVPVHEWGGRTVLRVSCHLYNDDADIDRLVAALRTLLGC